MIFPISLFQVKINIFHFLNLMFKTMYSLTKRFLFLKQFLNILIRIQWNKLIFSQQISIFFLQTLLFFIFLSQLSYFFIIFHSIKFTFFLLFFIYCFHIFHNHILLIKLITYIIYKLLCLLFTFFYLIDVVVYFLICWTLK